ncbi:MAG: glycosyltransferase family 9 protein [Alphaproteobacteria bacterium]|nr:glycosyltransferase family 9 protein [Alphaproteobacteria bacterium]
MKILFLSSTYVGDAILTTGLLAELIRRHPDAEVTIACGKAALPVFSAAPNTVARIGIVKRGKVGHWLDLWRATVGTAWDLVVDLRGSALAYVLWAKARHIFRPDHARGHRSFALAATIGLDHLPRPIAWTASEHEAAAAKILPEGPPTVVLASTGNWKAKLWTTERFAELATRLTSPGGPFPGGRIVVLGAPGEEPLTRPLAQALPAGQVLDLTGRTDLPTAAAVIKRAQLFIGVDSGLLYLATATGIPCLGLFGPTPGIFGPPSGDLLAPWAPNAGEARTPIPWQDLTSSSKMERDTMASKMGSLTVDAAEAAALRLLRRLEKIP